VAESFDVVVIGGGPGGYAAALYGAAAGLRIAVVEKDKVGGTCLHRGCIPAKQFLETAHVHRTVAGAKEFGIEAGQPSVDFAVSQARKQKVVDQLWNGLQGLMKRRKITTIAGTGRLTRHHIVKVDDGTELTAPNVILASGSVPRTIAGFDFDGDVVVNSDHVLDLTQLPGSVAVIGGGAIGCEFASMMSDLGVHVTLLEALPQILTGCDKDAADVVVKSFKSRGIDIRTGVKVRGHTRNGQQTTIDIEGDSGVTVDKVIVSVGRRPLTDGLVEDGTGVALDDRGYVTVDANMRTTAEGVYAVGDCVPTAQLAHVGFAEAIVAIKTILGESVVPVDYGAVPWAIYSHPEVAFAGMTEQAAKDAGHDVVVKKMSFAHNSRALIVGDNEGLVKVIAEKRGDGKAGRILGVHMAGPWVTEQLGQGYLSVNWEATPDEVGQFIQPHPTLSETFGEAVLALTGRGLHG
jgi:dihydrolipoamide dehydrogenase